ncbi:unnamed protein product [Adineta ricciae]|uniref:Uncharacterized protein n=1 Tax=Adineta ricciae TaxID=249248 RepID=A0A814UFT6_ADIRI|nr:unnamed protein product [Adineta ricciae]
MYSYPKQGFTIFYRRFQNSIVPHHRHMSDDKELMPRVEEIQTLAETNEDMMKQIDNMGSRVVNLTTYVISRTALGEIYKFAKNFRVIKAVLERITALLNDGGGGRLDKIRERLDNLNNQIKALRTTYTNIKFS